MKIGMDVLPPVMPNYIRFKQKPVKRQDGFKEPPGIAVADLDRDQAEQYADMMRAAFMVHWQSKQHQTEQEDE